MGSSAGRKAMLSQGVEPISSERRSHRRAPLQRTVQVVAGSQTVIMGTTEDISEGGLGLRISGRLAQRDLIKMFVPVPRTGGTRDRLCLLWGRVAWARDGRAGICFTDPPLEHQLTVRDYVTLAA